MIFIPHEYQRYTIDYIKSHPVAAAFLDCGLGKTVISLSALKDLIESGEVKKALVIAPLRVARDVWPAEIEKWKHLKGLKISVILGTPKQREEALKADAQIYVINRDNLSWLVSKKWPIYMFDTIVLDELSSYKNMRAARTRAAYRLCREAKRVIGLTGTPASNGLMDLWAEYAVMDGGAHLGTHLNSYQLKYFNPVFGYQGKAKTCEEYVLAELEEKKEQVKKLTAACKSYVEVMDDVNRFLDIMKERLNLHKAADGKEIITMGYIFEEYDPDDFKLLKELFHLEVKGEEKHE